MTTLQYMAISGLAYVDLDSLTDSNNDPWTIESLAKAGKIIGFAINPDTDEITVSKPELASLSSMLDWTIVNAQQNTSTGFAGIAVQAPSDGEIIFGLRGTEPPESGVDRLLNDMLTDAQLAVQGNTTSQPNQFDDAFDFFTSTLTAVGTGNYDSYSFTGHSLGGALAQYLTYQTNNVGTSVTFNAPGIGQALPSTTSLGSYNTTDYTNANDTIGSFGAQLGSTTYIEDSTSNNLSGDQIRDIAIWYGVLTAVSKNAISSAVGAVIINGIIQSGGPTGPQLEDLWFGAHGLETMLHQDGGVYSLNDNADPQSSNVSGVAAALQLLSNGASLLHEGKTYFVIFQDAKIKVAFAIINGEIQLLTMAGSIVSTLFYQLGATAAEIRDNVGQAINNIGNTAEENAWNILSYVFLANHIASDTDGTDSLIGWIGKNNILSGLNGDDYISGQELDDMLRGDEGNDIINGQSGDDFVYGGTGNDALYGGEGNDYLLGGEGDDSLYGDFGDVAVYNGQGQDLLDGGAGNDLLQGGGGDDTYKFGLGYGQDTIYDGYMTYLAPWYTQQDGGYDTIQFGANISPEDVTVVIENGGLMFKLNGSTDTLTVQGFFNEQNGVRKNAIEQVKFADEDQTIWSLSDLLEKARHINGTSGDDLLQGYGFQDDIILAGAGNDIIANTGAGTDYALGGEGDDTITMGTGDGFADGEEGDDNLYGGGGNNTLKGGAGNDVLYGDENVLANSSIGNDSLDGGTGNDMLYGGGGNDTYIFGLGYGQDIIADNYLSFLNPWYTPQNAGYDTVSFLPGVNPEDVSVTRNSGDLIFSISGTTDTLTVQSFFGTGSNGTLYNAVEEVVFNDTNSTIWTLADLLEKSRYINGSSGNDELTGYGDQDDVIDAGGGDDMIYNTGSGSDYVSAGNGNDSVWMGDGNGFVDGGSGNDTIYGGSGNDTLLGKGGDDTLYGDEATLVSSISNGDDILDGGTGNDMLYGGGGNDTYIFGLGYGQDIISDDQMSYYNRTYYQLNAGYDTISLLEGISPEDVSLRRDGMHLILSISNTSDTLTVQNFFSQMSDGTYYSATEEIRFDDTEETVWDLNDILEKVTHIDGTSESDTLYGFESNDTITAAEGNDSIYASGGNDTVDAGEGNDLVEGGAGNDLITGGDGNDTLYGDESYQYSSAAGNDTLVGRQGNDTLHGNGGNDTYLFSLGDGQDTISDIGAYYSGWGYSGYHNGGYDTIAFSSEIEPSDVTTIRVGNDLLLSIAGGTDSITVQNFFNKDSNGNYLYAIEEIRFDNTEETVWEISDILEKVRHINGTNDSDYLSGISDQESIIMAGAGNDTVYGDAPADYIDGEEGNDTLVGGAGNDTILGGSGNDMLHGDNFNDYYGITNSIGNDTLDGGTGNDTLHGDAGDDTYLFGIGDGQDIIYDYYYTGYWYSGEQNAGFDTVTFKPGVSPSDVNVTRQGEDLVFSINGTSDTLTVQKYFHVVGTTLVNAIEQITFADDSLTTWTQADLLEKARYIYGTSGDDTLSTYSDQSNIVEAGTGNDTLYGGYNNDTYIISAGDGADTITEAAGNDSVIFDYGLSGIMFAQAGNDLQISVAGSSDSLTINSWFSNTSYQIENFETTGGNTITSSQVELLIQAMATYSSNNSGISWIDAINTNPQDVQNILNQYWTAPSS